MSDPNIGLDKMQADGLILFYPQQDEFFVDLDGAEAEKQFAERFKKMREIFRRGDIFPMELPLITPSKSGNGSHVRVKMSRPISLVEGIALAAALGSDPMRELLNMQRYLNGIWPTSILAETPATRVANKIKFGNNTYFGRPLNLENTLG